jgi:hypothetical protein
VEPHNLFYYPYASFANEQLPLLKVAALCFDKLTILDPVGASWVTVGGDHVARDAIVFLKDVGILEVVTPADVLAKYADPLAEAVRRDMTGREFLELVCCSGPSALHRSSATSSVVPRGRVYTVRYRPHSARPREAIALSPC